MSEQSTGVVLTQEQKMQMLTNPEYTGNEMGSGGAFPPYINILQSDKQYDAFGEDGNKITKAMYGKLFIRKQDGNTLADLRDEIEGTVLKIAYGHEVRKIDDDGRPGDLVSSSSNTINKADKEQWLADHPGLTFKNMVKIIITLTDNKQELEDSIAAGDPLTALLPIKGSAWSGWFSTQKEMNTLTVASNEYDHKRAVELACTVFRFAVTSRKETSSDGRFEYYSPSIGVKLNTPDVAFDMVTYMMELKDLPLFGGSVNSWEEEGALSEADNTELAENILL